MLCITCWSTAPCEPSIILLPALNNIKFHLKSSNEEDIQSACCCEPGYTFIIASPESHGTQESSLCVSHLSAAPTPHVELTNQVTRSGDCPQPHWGTDGPPPSLPTRSHPRPLPCPSSSSSAPRTWSPRSSRSASSSWRPGAGSSPSGPTHPPPLAPRGATAAAQTPSRRELRARRERQPPARLAAGSRRAEDGGAGWGRPRAEGGPAERRAAGGARASPRAFSPAGSALAAAGAASGPWLLRAPSRSGEPRADQWEARQERAAGSGGQKRPAAPAARLFSAARPGGGHLPRPTMHRATERRVGQTAPRRADHGCHGDGWGSPPPRCRPEPYPESSSSVF